MPTLINSLFLKALVVVNFFMCLILSAIETKNSGNGNQYRMIIAANRDEFYARPSREAMFWPENPEILGGQDLSMGGTWLGITRSGRFAAVTNFRETPLHPAPPRSRGDLTTGFLTSTIPAQSYLEEIQSRGDEYRGFNLILGDNQGFYYLSNRQPDIINLPPGYYGLSNQQLNCDWPKVIEGRRQLNNLVVNKDENMNELTDSLFNLLSDKGDGRAFSNSFIESVEYGTRAKTVVLWHWDGSLYFEERSFKKNGEPGPVKRHDFRITA